jgi:hypothetical protein
VQVVRVQGIVNGYHGAKISVNCVGRETGGSEVFGYFAFYDRINLHIRQ